MVSISVVYALEDFALAALIVGASVFFADRVAKTKIESRGKATTNALL